MFVRLNGMLKAPKRALWMRVTPKLSLMWVQDLTSDLLRSRRILSAEVVSADDTFGRKLAR